MSEHDGAEASKTQLHLRVSAELVELLDSVRGPATRNAYAAMLLERALTGQAGEGRTAARDVKASHRTEPRAEATVAAPVLSSLPDLPGPVTVASALPKPKRSDCPHRAPRGSYCKLCRATV